MLAARLDELRDPVGGRDEDKREFLADVSAFANTAGGDLLFGVDESGGEANAVPGMALYDTDAEIRRLDGILLAGIEPRLPAVDLRWLPSPASQSCLVVRVPRSLLAPVMSGPQTARRITESLTFLPPKPRHA